mmetsp:Transcript_102278/g.203036  ORF Transcript_102278/g.203036 Transcript_102278/m.203036 type:complete len:100 (+) Transcript_102278:418-717(+)
MTGIAASAPFGDLLISRQQHSPQQLWPHSGPSKMGHEHTVGKGSECHYWMCQRMPNEGSRIARTASLYNYPKASLFKSAQATGLQRTIAPQTPKSKLLS